MARPKKLDEARARKFSVTLSPRADELLAAMMREDGEDNRSAAIAKLVIEEAARRRRRAKPTRVAEA